MGGGEERTEAEGLSDVENTVFVAVGKNVKESKSTLLWAARGFGGKRICLLHVHEPTQLPSLFNGMSAMNKLKQQAAGVLRDRERQRMHKLLNQYNLILAEVGVQAGRVWIEADSVEKGIVQIIAQHNVRWLVMGAAADKHYSKSLAGPTSKKAKFVHLQAPISCQISFTCNGILISSRSQNENSSPQIESIRTLSSSTSCSDSTLPQSNANADDDTIELIQKSGGFTSEVLVQSTKSTERVAVASESIPIPSNGSEGDDSSSSSPCESQDHLDYSLSTILLERKSNGEEKPVICGKLEHAIRELESSKQIKFEQSMKRWKAEEEASEATCEAEGLENSYRNEEKQRKELEEVFVRHTKELERMKTQHDKLKKELLKIRDQKPQLENQLMESCEAEKELEDKILQAVDLLKTFKGQRDKLQKEHDEVIREVHELRTLVGEDAADLQKLQLFAFSFWEINEATREFDPSCKIGDGRLGCVYKGVLRHLKVAIKMLPSGGSKGDLNFQHEAWELSKIRHPNLVALVGTCAESRSVVYEYVSNGSLEDHLTHQGKTSSLPWQTRIRIASEICSVLIFLHSSKPFMVHGNLKPTNILLDSHFVSKVSDLHIHRLIPHDENSTTIFPDDTDPETYAYLDPEFLETGELSVESDVYSFGIVLLRLLTGRPAVGVVKDVKCALERDNLDAVLDGSAGLWPVEQARNLARVGLSCCESKRWSRPDLVSGVLHVIERIRRFGTSSAMESKKAPTRVPSHFVCPIFQEVFEDPHIAADGFTYEADAIKGWLNSGHTTSPMTNLELDHCDLIPNYALYYAIQEWQQKSQ